MYFYEYSDDVDTIFGYVIKKRVEVIQTQFQTIEIFETKQHGYLMVIDGFVMLTSRDNYFYHEVMGHSCLVAHPDPKDVLIIGGGDCGTLSEVLSHQSVKSCTQIDIDKHVTELALKYFPELAQKNKDPRATVKFDDGVKWLKEADQSSYDVIIIDSTDPIGPGEGLFNQEFHNQCFRALRDDGIVVQQSESPLFQRKILDGIRSNFSRSGFNEVTTLAYPQPCYPSGLWSATLGSKKKIDWEKGYHRLQKAQGKRKFLSETMLKSLVLQSSCWPSEHVF